MDSYERKSKAPLWWYNKSSDLCASAGVIWIGMKDRHSMKMVERLKLGGDFRLGIACLPVYNYNMLCGLSLELIFKAILVSQDKKVKEIHTLDLLAEKASIEYSDKGKGIDFHTPLCYPNSSQL